MYDNVEEEEEQYVVVDDEADKIVADNLHVEIDEKYDEDEDFYEDQENIETLVVRSFNEFLDKTKEMCLKTVKIDLIAVGIPYEEYEQFKTYIQTYRVSLLAFDLREEEIENKSYEKFHKFLIDSNNHFEMCEGDNLEIDEENPHKFLGYAIRLRGFIDLLKPNQIQDNNNGQLYCVKVWKENDFFRPIRYYIELEDNMHITEVGEVVHSTDLEDIRYLKHADLEKLYGPDEINFNHYEPNIRELLIRESINDKAIYNEFKNEEITEEKATRAYKTNIWETRKQLKNILDEILIEDDDPNNFYMVLNKFIEEFDFSVEKKQYKGKNK